MWLDQLISSEIKANLEQISKDIIAGGTKPGHKRPGYRGYITKASRTLMREAQSLIL
jgi:hypothetical protein